MVLVGMRENDCIQSAHMVAGESRAQRCRIRAGIDQHRMRPIPHDDRIALSHIEDRQAHPRRRGRTYNHRCRQRDGPSCGPACGSFPRRGPAGPQPHHAQQQHATRPN